MDLLPLGVPVMALVCSFGVLGSLNLALYQNQVLPGNPGFRRLQPTHPASDKHHAGRESPGRRCFHMNRRRTMIGICQFGAGRIGRIHAANVAQHPEAALESYRHGKPVKVGA